MPDQTKIYSVRQIVPTDLEQDIIKSNTLDTYLKVKTYIIEQTSIRKEMKSSKNTGPVPMEIDMFNKLLAEMNKEESGCNHQHEHPEENKEPETEEEK